MRLLDELEAFFTVRAPLAVGETVLVAYSGGGDSTALLWALRELASAGRFQVAALHLDHATDPGSAGRAAAALRLAERLGAPCALQRIDVPELRGPGEGIEAAGRRLRYAALDGERRRLGARYVATAHHRDDQSETVALRLLFGSGVEGLAGILPRRGAVVRPLLSLTRLELERSLDELAARGSAPDGEIHPLRDPGNDDLAPLRNRLRHSILPHLERAEPGTGERLARLGERAERARRSCEPRLEVALQAQRLSGSPSSGATLRLSSFLALPPEIQALALALLHRLAGAPHPPAAAARGELLRQLAGAQRTACDCGSGWRWKSQGDRLALLPPSGEPGAAPQFTYTLQIPGEVEIPEIAVRMKVSRDDRSESGTNEGHERAAGQSVGLTLPAGSKLTVRSRRPGDRLHPLGAPGSRRLKEVLIDRRVPRGERDRIPLLCCDGRIAWVPGVTIDQSFRRSPHGSPHWMDAGTSWIAEITHS